jgi:hypothetical protein
MLIKCSAQLAFLIFMVIAGASVSCGTEDKRESSGLSGIPNELRAKLVQSCDYVDIIFYNSPASLSQTEPQSIRRALEFIGNEPASLNETCKPIGRISYISSGEITAEGDMYLSDQCQYIVFMEDNKPVYANTMTTQGVQFFQEIVRGINQQLENQ